MAQRAGLERARPLGCTFTNSCLINRPPTPHQFSSTDLCGGFADCREGGISNFAFLRVSPGTRFACSNGKQSANIAKRPTRKAQGRGPVPRGDIKVREFEQLGDDASTRKSIKADPFGKESETVLAKLVQLEKELQHMKQGPFGPTSDFMKSLPVDEREDLLKKMEEQGIWGGVGDLLDDHDLEFDEEEQDKESASEPMAVTLRIPAQDKIYVKQFNAALKKAQDSPDDTATHLMLWKWYLRCQQRVQTFSSFVSEDVWNLLWESQQRVYPRSKHIILLAKDMMNAGESLAHSQTIDYIEALHHNENTATAIRLWEKSKSEIGVDRENAKRYWETGIRLYAVVGRPNKAQEIAFNSFENDAVEVNIFVDVIRAWAESKQPSAPNRLWFCYLRLKEKHIDDNIPTEVLGQISSILLKAGRQEMALAVFKDMIGSGSEQNMDSINVYTQMLKSYSSADESPVKEEAVNRIGLTALLAFPRKFKNKFFFGAWIKWLIGEGKVDDAALVLELMQEHGVMPDAKHLNGIIGAWFRDGSPAAKEKAAQLAWAMIQSRIKMVQSREGQDGVVQAGEAAASGDSISRRLPRFLRREVPPANVETFSVLLLRYTRQSDIEKATQLTQVMTGPAKIKPNSFILNHWLYMSLRASDLQSMWDRYRSVKGEIEPDLETFTALWDGLRRNLDRAVPARSTQYPNPRQLFAEMKMWLKTLEPKKRHQAEKVFSGGLYEQIIRCFCLSTDLHGTFVALQDLHDTVNALPHDDVARMILMQVARMLPANSPLASKPRRAAIKRRDTAYRSALSNLANVLQSISDHKATIFVEHGASQEEIEDPESPLAGELRLQVLSGFLCMVLKRQLAVDGSLANELIVAAKFMKVPLTEADLQQYLAEAESDTDALL